MKSLLRKVLNRESFVNKAKRCFFFTTKNIRFSKDPFKTILRVEENFLRNPIGKRVALISHFDPDGEFDETFLFYVNQIRISGFSVVVISTANQNQKSVIKRMLDLSSAVIFRENIGLDFASWSCAIKKYSLLEVADELLLTNDSIIPLFKPFDSMFEKLHASESLFTGLTESHEKERHFQSYFLHIKAAAWQNKKVSHFLKGIRAFNNKSSIINLYEIGLSRLMFNEGISHEALISYDSLTRSLTSNFEFFSDLGRKNLNPILYMWMEIILYYEIPLIKRELLISNFIGSKKVHCWKTLLNTKKENNMLIMQYVNRYKKGISS